MGWIKYPWQKTMQTVLQLGWNKQRRLKRHYPKCRLSLIEKAQEIWKVENFTFWYSRGTQGMKLFYEYPPSWRDLSTVWNFIDSISWGNGRWWRLELKLYCCRLPPPRKVKSRNKTMIYLGASAPELSAWNCKSHSTPIVTGTQTQSSIWIWNFNFKFLHMQPFVSIVLF